jgi:hypothetical protein
VIARHPQDAREQRRQRFERVMQVRRPLADIAGDDEPIVWVRGKPIERLAVFAMRQVQVADGQQPHGSQSRGRGFDDESPIGVLVTVRRRAT